MTTYLNQIFVREVTPDYYFSNSTDGRRTISAAYGFVLVHGVVDDLAAGTREINFFIEDSNTGRIFEVSCDSFNLLLSWSVGSDRTIKQRHVVNWLQQAKDLWGSVKYNGSYAL